MSDDADRAEEQEQMLRQVAMATRRRDGPAFTGFCANCGEPIAPPLRWCDVECRDDWTKREGR